MPPASPSSPAFPPGFRSSRFDRSCSRSRVRRAASMPPRSSRSLPPSSKCSTRRALNGCNLQPRTRAPCSRKKSSNENGSWLVPLESNVWPHSKWPLEYGPEISGRGPSWSVGLTDNSPGLELDFANALRL